MFTRALHTGDSEFFLGWLSGSDTSPSRHIPFPFAAGVSQPCPRGVIVPVYRLGGVCTLRRKAQGTPLRPHSQVCRDLCP